MNTTGIITLVADDTMMAQAYPSQQQWLAGDQASPKDKIASPKNDFALQPGSQA